MLAELDGLIYCKTQSSRHVGVHYESSRKVWQVPTFTAPPQYLSHTSLPFAT